MTTKHLAARVLRFNGLADGGCVWQTQVMSWVFTLWLVGSFFIFLLARMLGADISYSQSVGVIGYSLLPLVVVSMLLFVIPSGLLQAVLQVCTYQWLVGKEATSLMLVCCCCCYD
jgi:phosphotransferase system  glucose/maltose/N-acetylglucosamine-specific IIC component